MNVLDGSERLHARVYEDRLLAFVDILGFSNLIDATISDASKAESILNLLTSLNDSCAKFQSGDMSVTVFSDTICISYHNPPNLASFCCGLSLVATSLLGRGYVIRGALVRGLLYHKGNIIFGPCLIRAHSLEQRLAIFPRIIIDPQLPFDSSGPDEVALQPMYYDRDGLRCVNILSPVLLHLMFRLMGMPGECLIAEIMTNIDRLLSKTSDEAALQKLNWLRAYANRTLSSPKPDDMLIDRLVRQIRSPSA
jgi:hypothetical protein